MRSTGRTDVAIRNAADFLGSGELDEGLWYSVKRRLLGPPMVNEELRHQRLSKPLALGVLSPDCISSSAYGTEEILIALLPLAGLAAFTLVLPMTLVILVVMALVVLSYRQVVMVYIRPGGSYVVARENFGPRVAADRRRGAAHRLRGHGGQSRHGGHRRGGLRGRRRLGPYTVPITVGVILLMLFGKPARDQGSRAIFAVPTYSCSRGRVIDDRHRPGPRGHSGAPAASTIRTPPAWISDRHPTRQASAHGFATILLLPAGVRQRWRVADRPGGGLRRRSARFRPPEGHQRPQGAGHHGLHPRLPGGRDRRCSRTSPTRRPVRAATRP